MKETEIERTTSYQEDRNERGDQDKMNERESRLVSSGIHILFTDNDIAWGWLGYVTL